jgi:peptidoglycan L-alanyl-D-glutamate endopeptidase CwlK
MTYELGAGSRSRLAGVHPRLVAVVERAMSLTEQDFTVQEGLRTIERQRQLVAKGASKTMASKHIVQADGFGHAVDLVPFEDGPRWEWPLIYPVAHAMRTAAEALGVNLVWGGVWDRQLGGLSASPEGLKADVATYCVRHPGPDFLDGPHYQLSDAG